MEIVHRDIWAPEFYEANYVTVHMPVEEFCHSGGTQILSEDIFRMRCNGGA